MATTGKASQIERFREAAGQLGCDEDPAHFEEKLKKVAAHKPSEAAPKSLRPKKAKAE